MVSSQDEEVLRILDFVCQEQADGLERLLASVHVITKEQIIGFRREATVLEQAEEIVVLTVNIATDLSDCQLLPCYAMYSCCVNSP